jgi:hypothetical protein
MRIKVSLAALLILTMAVSASACVEGMGSAPGERCSPSQTHCSRVARSGKCGAVLKSSPSHCDVRGLLQFHFAASQKSNTTASLRRLPGCVVIPSRLALRLSSIGSPETDRGPPLS